MKYVPLELIIKEFDRQLEFYKSVKRLSWNRDYDVVKHLKEQVETKVKDWEKNKHIEVV